MSGEWQLNRELQIQNPESALTMLARLSRIILPPLVVVAALLAYRLAFVSAGAEQIQPVRREPWTITARYDEPRVVTDEQLAAVLDRVKPPAKPLKTNNMVHALRLWGVAADFHDPKVPTGRQMREYLLDDRAFRQFAGDETPPLFYRDKDGLAVRSFDDALTNRDTSSYHADDLLATLAEVGTSLDTPMHLRDGEATVGQLLNDSLSRFHLDRLEYEWAVISYARYVFPEKQFSNKFGDRINVNQLVDEAITPALGLGPCNGLHRLEALTVLLRADEQAHALRPDTKRKILAFMKRVSDLLTQSQTSAGYWTRQWPQGPAAATPAKGEEGDVYDRILVTGHQLEWLALAPESVQPPRETMVRAGQWLARTLLELDQKDLEAAYGPYTHAARSLALWRNQDPYQAWLRGRSASVSLVPNSSNR
jgi:hypothetical protein